MKMFPAPQFTVCVACTRILIFDRYFNLLLMLELIDYTVTWALSRLLNSEVYNDSNMTAVYL